MPHARWIDQSAGQYALHRSVGKQRAPRWGEPWETDPLVGDRKFNCDRAAEALKQDHVP